jgi:hypothetical protein
LSYFSADLTHHPHRLLCTFHAPATPPPGGDHKQVPGYPSDVEIRLPGITKHLKIGSWLPPNKLGLKEAHENEVNWKIEEE